MNARTDRDAADKLAMASIRLTRTLTWLGRGGPLTSPQIGALVVIAYAGRIVARDLAAHQQITAATMSRLLSQLEARGLITRKADPSDSRLQWIAATPKGVALVSGEHEKRLAPLVGAIRKLSPRERSRVIEAAELIESLTKTVAKAR
jgi:DNA-binding MarR family transcriptional regulator